MLGNRISRVKSRARRGFSLVELLAVVLVLAVLAAVAVPLYTSQRKSAAGRACKANLAAISASLSAWVLREDAYPPGLASLVGAAEGFTEEPVCPLSREKYTYDPIGGTGGGASLWSAPIIWSNCS